MKWSIENKTAAGLSLVGLILLIVAVLSYRNGSGFIETSQWVSHTHEVLAEIEATASAVTDAETGVRGYVMTGQESYLEPYQTAASGTRDHVDRLRWLTRDNPRQQRRILMLEETFAERLDLLKQSIDLRRQKGFEAAQRVLLGGGAGKKQMDEVRNTVVEMKREEEELLTRRVSDFQSSTRRAALTFSLVIFLEFALLGLVYYVVQRDVTERKRAQDALLQSEERFELAVRGSNDGIWDWNLVTNEVYLSPRWKSMLGYEGPEIPNQFDSWEKVVHPKDHDRTLAGVQAHLEGLTPSFEIEQRLLHKDGTYRWILARGVCLREASGKAYRMAGSHTDITERKRAEDETLRLNSELGAANRQLELRNREVERATQLKSQFLASMSHELRTPLNAILGFSDLLAEGTAGPLAEKQQRFIGHVRTGARHLLALINDILDLSKIESGLLELKCESFSISEAMPEVLSIIRPLAMAKKIHIEQSGENLSVFGDRIRFKQILYNLLSNALKFTPEGGKVAIKSSAAGSLVCLSVTDKGVGIRREDQGLIFEEFRQVGETAGGVKEGTGLGLAIAKRLVEQQGGSMDVVSEPGKGSCFSFTLPVGRAVPETAPRVPAQVRAVNAHGTDGKPLILIVDDEAAARELLTSYLETAGYATALASSSAEVIEKARQLHPSAITLDITMPHASGFEALFQLKTTPETANIPVIVVSVVDQKQMGFTLGAAEYLVKPVQKSALLEAVGKHVRPQAGRPNNILVVDDDPKALDLVSDILRSGGYTPRVVSSGKEALRLLAELPVDAVLLDLVMPEMDGFQVLRKMKEHPAWGDIPVFVVTAKDLTDSEIEFLKCEARALFRKDGSWTVDLLTEVRKAIGNSKLAQSAGQS
jgi:PAS domain S-box-containing protein